MPRRLILLDENLAISRFNPADAIPGWAAKSSFFSITKTRDELSIVTEENVVPEGTNSSKGWRALRIEGALDFAAVGVLHTLLAPLVNVEVSVFAISTFDTDYLLIKEEKVKRAVSALIADGFSFSEGEPIH